MKKKSLELWEPASNYLGEDFRDYYIGPSISRDSGALEKSNFEVALEMLGGEGDGVSVERFSHWAVGWIEVILVHKDASDKIAILEDIERRLEDYPILDEYDYSEKESEEITENYNSWGKDYIINIINLDELMDFNFDSLSDETRATIEDSLWNLYRNNAEYTGSEVDVDERGVEEDWKREIKRLSEKGINFIYTYDGMIVGVWGESDIEELKQYYGEDEIKALPEHEPVPKEQMSLPFESKKAQEFEVVNPEDEDFWKNTYLIYLGPFGSKFVVYADNEDDALDYLIDYADEKNYKGFFLDDEKINELEEEGCLDEYISGGNYGKYLSFPENEVRIKRIKSLSFINSSKYKKLKSLSLEIK